MRPRFYSALILLALSACNVHPPARVPANEAASAHPQDAMSVREPEVTSPSAVASLIDRHRACDTICCLGGIPQYVWSWAPDVADTASLAEARAILKGPAPARVRAIAALRLGAEMRPEDVALLAPLVRSGENAGDLPFERPEKGQSAPDCPAIEWSRHTLGSVVLDALHHVTGGRFRSADEFDAWMAAHRDLESSVDYWMGALAEASHRPLHVPPAPPRRLDEMLASLQARPEILVRVSLALSWDGHGPPRAQTVRLVRETLTVPRLVRLVLGTETLPELEDRSRHHTFVQHVCDIAPDLADPTLSAALRRLWNEHRFADDERIEGALALALLTLYPADARALVEEGVDRLPSARHDLMKAFAERHRDGEEDFLLTFFHDPRPTRRDARPSILRGVRARGPKALPFLKKVALGGARVDEPWVLTALVDAVAAVDPSAACPRRGEMEPFRRKGWHGDEAEIARIKEIVQSAQEECLRFVRAWLAAH